MKKSTFITLLLIIFVLMAGTVSAYFFVRGKASDTYQKQNQEQAGNRAAEEAADESTPRELESMIYYNDTLYSLTQVEKHPVFDENRHELYGVIEESVNRYERPVKSLTANDELLVGKELYHFVNELYSDALSVCVDDETWIYAPHTADRMDAETGAVIYGAADAQCPYNSLTFSGRDVNAQHYPRSYSTEDKELINKVWAVLNSSDRIEVSEYEGYEDVMDLQFFGENESERVILLPNDNCKYIGTGKKYCLTQGSYTVISSLLTDYTTANYSFTIDEDFLNIDTDSQEELVFMFDASDVYVSPSVTGDFTEDWVLIPVDIQNWDHEGRFGYIQNIYTREGFGPVEIAVHFDELMIVVQCDGKSKAYYTDQSTMDSIDQLVESVRNH